MEILAFFGGMLFFGSVVWWLDTGRDSFLGARVTKEEMKKGRMKTLHNRRMKCVEITKKNQNYLAGRMGLDTMADGELEDELPQGFYLIAPFGDDELEMYDLLSPAYYQNLCESTGVELENGFFEVIFK